MKILQKIPQKAAAQASFFAQNKAKKRSPKVAQTEHFAASDNPQKITKSSPQKASITPQKILLVGNPNAGKSTIFNRLTHGSARTGNWNGVTVDVDTRTLERVGQQYQIADLPGIYGLTAFSQDEKNALAHLNQQENALIINIIDSATLAKSLHLTLQLIASGRRVVLLFNFVEQAGTNGTKIDYKKIGVLLGVPVLCYDPKNRDFDAQFWDKIRADTSQKAAQNPIPAQSAQARKKQIDRLLACCVIGQGGEQNRAYTGLDKIANRPFRGVLIFVIILLFIFWLTFGAVGSWLSEMAVFAWELCAKSIMSVISLLNLPSGMNDFFADGMLGSIGGVIGFLPQICLLWFCLEFLEQSGYIARIVWVLEPLLNKIGLSGKSAFSMLLGFGCTTIAVPSVLAIKSPVARQKTASILPFFTCNAKLPVLLCVASAIFPQNAFVVVFLLYLLGVGVAIAVAGVWQALRPTPIQNEIIEFTPLVLPKFGALCRQTLRTAGNFLRKIWSVVLICGVIIWFASSFDFALRPVAIEESILSKIAQLIAPIFAPLGLGWGSVVALVVGIAAKEMVLSTIAVLNGTTALSTLLDPMAVVHFDTFSGVAFLVFCVLYTPCVSALAQLRAILPKRAFWGQVVGQFVLAYCVSWLVMTAVKAAAKSGTLAVVVALVLAIMVGVGLFFVLKRRKSCSKCNRNCNFCKGG